MRLSRIFALIFALSAAALVDTARADDAGDAGTEGGPPPSTAFTLLTGFSAKETCSCAFDVQQTDDYCIAFGHQGDYTLSIQIDHAKKIVTSSFLDATRTAHFTDGVGCELDP